MRFVETVMGIPMSVEILELADDAAVALAREAFELIKAADRRFSTYRDDSEVAAVNRGSLCYDDYSEDLREVLAIAERAERNSGHAFSARLPGRNLDLNGVVKGWAVQRAADLLVARHVEAFCFNAGGDVIVHGRPTGLPSWNIAVRSPWDAAGHLAVLAVTDGGAVATSGSYERGAHILDGRTGCRSAQFASVTVLAPRLTTADVLATSVFVLGDEGLPWALEQGATAVLAVRPDASMVGAGAIPLATAEATTIPGRASMARQGQR